jgi:nucleotide-binding universal stress UspA family protein
MLKHCILSVDYSADWDRTLDYLPAIIPLMGVQQLTLVHVIETFRRQHIHDNQAVVEGKLKALASKLSADLGLQVEVAVRRGFAASELLETARQHSADAVITLNCSHSSSREILRGNIALNLARMTRIPLLILPLDGKVPEPDGLIMLATDGSASAHAAEARFHDFMHKGHHGLVIWVDDDEVEDDEEAKRCLTAISGQHANATVQRLKGSPAKEIAKAAEQENAALLIIGKRGTTPIKELLLGSTAEAIARQARRPVLLVP